MKKLLLILSIFLIPLQACAFEDYILTSDKPVISVSSSDESILSVLPFFTIDNNKDTIIVKAKKEGDAQITIKRYDKNIIVKVKVTPEKIIFTSGDDVAFFPLDIPENSKGFGGGYIYICASSGIFQACPCL